MSYNLTSKQRDDLQWVVECTESGDMDETFIVDWMDEGLIKNEEWASVRQGSEKKLKRGTLDAWDRAGLVIVTFKESPANATMPMGFLTHFAYARCTLTQAAYDAVATGFVGPGRPVNPNRLFSFLSNHFSMNELHTVAAMMGIRHETLEGRTVDVYARELVSYAQRRSLLWELVGVALSLE